MLPMVLVATGAATAGALVVALVAPSASQAGRGVEVQHHIVFGASAEERAATRAYNEKLRAEREERRAAAREARRQRAASSPVVGEVPAAYLLRR